VTSGPLREIQEQASLVRTPAATELRRALEAAGATVESADPESLLVRGLRLDEIGEEAYRAGIALHELSPHAGSLEQLFLGWTAGDLDTGEEEPA
jgi:ABC-2 type transport system ATP-binding protein